MKSSQNLALIIGSSGGLGAALLAQLEGDAKYAQAIGLSRSTEVGVNYDDETSIAKASQHIADLCKTSNLQLRLLVVATGFFARWTRPAGAQFYQLGCRLPTASFQHQHPRPGD